MIQYIKLFIVATLFCFGTSLVHASNYNYEKLEIKEHVIHMVTVIPKYYDIDIVKANNGAIGRETVSSMAKRTNATIAINAGFFEIGGKRDGVPSGTLVIKGRVYSMKGQVQPIVLINSDKFSIIQANPKNYISSNVSMVSGIPLLVSDGEIVHDIFKKNSQFYSKAHARTAIGIKPDGAIIIAVVEHHYLKDLTTISMGEIQSLMKEKGKFFSKKYHHQSAGDITFDELKEILKEEFTPQHRTKGLTMLELAQLMKEQGCKYALNLDGGESSTLWINGKIINETIGDVDEENSLKTVQLVSDAIVFRDK